MDETDLTNYSSPSSHRLPTISASAALRDAAARNQGIPSCLPTLDDGFVSTTTTTSNPKARGVPRGQVTEVSGPPGVGKTAFAMQVAANALRHSHRVVWIDTGSPMPGPRFEEILACHRRREASSQPPPPPNPGPTGDDDDEDDDADNRRRLKNLSYLTAHTLPHLLVLFLHPAQHFPPQKTSLIVVDNVSAPLNTAFPRSTDTDRRTRPSAIDPARRSHQRQWAATNANHHRKCAVAGDLAAGMSKVAALNDIAVLVINQFATGIKVSRFGEGGGGGGRGGGARRRAVLKPAISGIAWEASIHNRILLWRDHRPLGLTMSSSSQAVGSSAEAGEEEAAVARMRQKRVMKTRYVQIVKAGGKIKLLYTAAQDAVPFVIDRTGLRELDPPSKSTPIPPTPLPPAILDSTTAVTAAAAAAVGAGAAVSTSTKDNKAAEIADSEDEEDIAENTRSDGGGDDLLRSDAGGHDDDEDDFGSVGDAVIFDEALFLGGDGKFEDFKPT